MTKVASTTITDPIFLIYTNEFQMHIDKANYFLGFLDPSSKKPGLIGMISWEALKEGLNAEKTYFLDTKSDDSLTLKERDQRENILVKIEMALECIS